MRQGSSRKSGRSRWRAVAAGVVVAVLAGGCGVVDFVQDTMDDAATAGEPPVLVTAAEKEEIGYEVPAGMGNPRLQELAVEHREEIYAEVQARVQAELGRAVEVGGIAANIPRSSLISVRFRTLDEPVVAARVFLGLGSDGSVQGFEPVERNEDIEGLTVRGLYYMAYRERVAQLREYLLATYPQFVQMPAGYAWNQSMLDPVIGISVYNRYKGEDYQKILAEQAEVYAAYVEQPVRSDEEWRAVFEEVYGDRELSLLVTLMLADPAAELTEEMSRQVAEDVRSNPLFAGFGEWGVFTHSNLMLRGGPRSSNPFHQGFIMRADRDLMDWIVQFWQDGGTMWDGRDGQERWYSEAYTGPRAESTP